MSIVAKVMKLVNREDTNQKLLASEMALIRKQIKGVNMVDQFATYARLNRKLNALTDKYKEKMNARTTANQKVRMCVQMGLQAVVGISCLWLVYQHRSFPVVSLDPDLLWPIGGILAMPSCQVGEISVLVWLGMTRTVSRKLSQYITNVRQSAANAASLDPLSIALD
ncbi:guided entry of tail-anchored proteins factor 1-like isoform X2 [Oratosquilla oratoria]|uniref:guided entry of tail-anchored proteins factor 1-like isoform X2 n=1 Tax=Oratosquilla oratoria TaxID=337810 RepID=UPI003F7604B0